MLRSLAGGARFLQTPAMSYCKESVVSDVTHTADELPTIVAKLQGGGLWSHTNTLYPFSHVLRLRVLQIVCGISIVVMGSVACIEDQAALTRLGLGVPAGLLTVLAAGASIHLSRGFGGYRPSSCQPASLRFLGPSPSVAVPLTGLWLATCALHGALVLQAIAVFTHSRSSQTSFLLAVVETVLSTLTLAAVVWVIRIDCCYDPD